MTVLNARIFVIFLKRQSARLKLSQLNIYWSTLSAVQGKLRRKFVCFELYFVHIFLYIIDRSICDKKAQKDI